MACSLIEHKRITTTVAKAKALRVYVEPLLTKSKEDSTNSRRVVFSSLQSKTAVSELFREIAPKIASRPGGYTRIIRVGNRPGDNAEMCLIELVDYNELMLSEKTEKKTTRRSRRGGKGKAKVAEGSTATPKAEEKTTEKPKAVKAEKAEVEAPAPAKEEKEVAKPAAEKKEEAPKAEVKKEEKKKDAGDEEKSDDK